MEMCDEMIRVAFCDDDLLVLNKIEALLDKYRRERSQEIEYVIFNSPFNLLFEIERGMRYDILFLDILMPGENGINVAEEIRNYDSNVKIIFLTSSSEYAVQSYTVDAYFYQLKPVREDAFFSLMDSVLAECEKEQTTSLILRCKSGITRIEPRQFEYCEVMHRTLLIHMSTGKVFESNGSLDELSKQVESYGCFMRPHRSYLVNMEYIQSLSYRAITMSSMVEIPIPRGKYGEIKDMFLEYAFRNRQVMI